MSIQWKLYRMDLKPGERITTVDECGGSFGQTGEAQIVTDENGKELAPFSYPLKKEVNGSHVIFECYPREYIIRCVFDQKRTPKPFKVTIFKVEELGYCISNWGDVLVKEVFEGLMNQELPNDLSKDYPFLESAVKIAIKKSMHYLCTDIYFAKKVNT